MKKGVKIAIGAGVAAVLAGAGLIYWNLPETVETAEAKEMDLTASISEVGHIKADECITIYAPVSGRVSNIQFQVNDSVSEDDLMLSYDTNALETAYYTAVWTTAYYTDGYQAAVAENNKYSAMADAAAKDAQECRQQYIATMQSMDELSISQELENYFIQTDMNNLNAVLDNLNLELTVQLGNLEAAQTLYNELQNQTWLAEAEYKELDKKAEKTSDEDEKAEIKAERDAKRTEWNKLKEARDDAASKKAACEHVVNDLKAQIEEYRVSLASMPLPTMTTEESLQYSALERQREILLHDWEQNLNTKANAEGRVVDPALISQLEDSVEQAKLQEEAAKKAWELGKKGVCAEFSGTVMERLVDEGAVVEAGTPLFVIQPSCGYKAELLVSRFDIDSVEIGQSAEIRIGDTVYEGTVSNVAAVATPDASGKPKVKVEVTLNESEKTPIIGLEADVCIFVSEETDVLCIPERAIYTDDNGSYVYILKDGRVEKQSVSKSMSDGTYVKITEGLAAGDQVVVSPCSDENIGMKAVAEGE